MSPRKPKSAYSDTKRRSNPFYSRKMQAEKRQKVEKISSSKVTTFCDNCTNLVPTSTMPTITTTTNPYQASTSFSPPTFSPSSHPLGLITKTTDAIYRALSSVFSYDEHVSLNSSTKAPNKNQGLTTVSPLSTPRPSSVVGSNSTASLKPPIKNLSTTTYKQTSTTATMTKPPTTKKTTTINQSSSASTVRMTTTLRPRTSTTSTLSTAKQASSSIATTSLSSMTTDRSSQLLDLMSNLIKSLDSLREVQNNRTIRVAPDVDFGDFGVESGKLVIAPDNQAATSEDVHLLCKLLQKHLTLSSNNVTTLVPSNLKPSTDTFNVTTSTMKPSKTIESSATIATTDSTPFLTTKTTLSNQPTITPVLTNPSAPDESTEDLQYVMKADDLGEKHERHLLVSILNFDRGQVNETRAERLLSESFNDGARINRIRKLPIDGASDYELENPANDKESTPSPPPTLLIHRWPKYTKRPRSNHLHLVYWLLARPSDGANDTRLKVIDAHEANALLDELEHSQLKRHLSAASISVPGPIVSAFNVSSITDGNELNHKDEQEPPRAIDDSLISSGEQTTKQPVGSFQLFLDKLTGSSFTEYLYLYLILFIFLLLMIILCFAIPMMSCKVSNSNSNSNHDSTTRRTSRRSKVPEAPIISSISDPSNRAIINFNNDEQQKAISTDSIWRKLSSSTSTLVRDESRELRSDGTMAVPVIPENPQEEQMAGKRAQFEWYSFEDRLEQVTRTLDKDSQTYTLHEDKISKSLRNRTYSPETNITNEEQLLEFKDRNENRSSNTLTKSELVMLKEKLVPIASSLRRQVGSQTSFEQEPVNLSANKEKSKLSSTSGTDDSQNYIHDSLASHFIDSTEASCSIGADDLRRPKMRHVELPARTSSKVDAIKAELSRVEKRDKEASVASPSSSKMPSSSTLKTDTATYKRYEL